MTNDKTKDGLLTITQVCDLFKITRPTLYNWNIKPKLKEGRNNYYDHNEIVEYKINEALKNVKPVYHERDDEVTLEDVKIRLTLEQVKKLERQNRLANQELVPIDYLVDVINHIAVQISGILDSLPLTMVRKHPELTRKQQLTLKSEIIKCMNLCATIGDTFDEKIYKRLEDEYGEQSKNIY